MIINQFGGGAEKVLKTEIFTQSGSWTCPAGVEKAFVRLFGGGGGSGGDRSLAADYGGGGGAHDGGIGMVVIDVEQTAAQRKGRCADYSKAADSQSPCDSFFHIITRLFIG